MESKLVEIFGDLKTEEEKELAKMIFNFTEVYKILEVGLMNEEFDEYNEVLGTLTNVGEYLINQLSKNKIEDNNIQDNAK